MVFYALGITAGYMIGRHLGTGAEPKEIYQNGIKYIKQTLAPPQAIPTGVIHRTGVIHHKTEGEKKLAALPPNKREGIEEMKKMLDGIPELKAAKDYLEQTKQI